ncbi:MAG: V-type ATP synthase subunit E [Synergistaceae bacterium]|jgi:V/A-type H+-transporting ATPase subunit E|nr:V-type ATP synthase subunit E [Synergistaceae bacterium]
MSLAQITEKIERDARDEADKIIYAAREREREIRRDAEREIKHIEEAASARFEKERPEIFKRREIVAKLDVDKLHLGVKRQLIQDVFDEGLERLKGLKKDEYLRFCEGLLKEAASTGSEVMEIAQGEQFIGPEWVAAFNSSNAKKITISQDRQDFSGGFVLNDGRVSVNCSWEMLMRAAQEKLEPEVVKRLFPATA